MGNSYGNLVNEMTWYGFLFSSIDGVSLVNEDGGLGVFFPNNSFVTNTTFTHSNTPWSDGKDHIACYGGDPQDAQVTWHNRWAAVVGSYRSAWKTCERLLARCWADALQRTHTTVSCCFFAIWDYTNRRIWRMVLVTLSLMKTLDWVKALIF